MLIQFFKVIDSFSKPISLNLQKEYKHRTPVGGVFTIFMGLVLAIFLFSKVIFFPAYFTIFNQIKIKKIIIIGIIIFRKKGNYYQPISNI